MPTPRPIIMPTIFVMLGTSVKPANTPTAAPPRRMPMSAVPIGRPMATTEPNAMSSTMTATPRPIISLPGSACSTCARLPVNSVAHAGGT